MKNLSKIAEFYGEEENPLLAPRGVFLHEKTLVVSDTGQNRVFIWYNFSFDKYQSPSVVLGQKDSSQKERNAGHAVSAASLQYPSGIWTDGKRLIVADAWNHRVLIWNQMPSYNFQEASIVIGQRDFLSNQPNIEGIGKSPGQNTLNWPYGVYCNGNSLWIADTGNRRVLFFEKIPTVNNANANAVVGQKDFCEKDYDNNNAVWPYSVKINNNGSMLIADTQFYRVLYWKDWTKSLSNSPNIIIGQNSLTESGQNQYQLKPNAHTLNWVYDACFYEDGIVIADTGNSRLILHDQIPTVNNAPAVSQIGQPNFETHGETSLSMKSPVANEMYWPFSVNSANNLLISADTGNHRILFYK